jgi:hypothetical protein
MRADVTLIRVTPIFPRKKVVDSARLAFVFR